MYKYKVELECIVPMLHFQRKSAASSDKNEGATLRGSEFKPMLDRFICDMLETNEAKYINSELRSKFVDEKMGEYLLPVENNVKSFRYSVSIREKEEKKEKKDYYTKELPVNSRGSLSFFLKDYIEDNKLSLYAPRVEVVFRSEFKEILEQIEKILPFFLAITQFGFRKGKGFGQFRIASESADNPAREQCLREICKLFGDSFIEYSGTLNDFLSNVDTINAYIKQVLIKKYATDELRLGTEKDIFAPYEGKIRFVRVWAGLPNQINRNVIKPPKGDRWENPIKYYTNEKRDKLFIIIKRNKIEAYLNYLDGRDFKIGTGNLQIKAPTFEELDYDRLVKFLNNKLRYTKISYMKNKLNPRRKDNI